MRYRLQCNFCNEVFVHTGDAYPDKCPLCGAYVGLDGKPEVTLPFLSSKADKSPDDLYRSMEEGAKHRAYLAAEMTGRPVSDMSAMLQTNMRDGLREGDTSYVPTQLKDGMTAQFGQGDQRVDPNVIAGVRSGKDPNYGASQMPVLNKIHREHGQALVARGTRGKY